MACALALPGAGSAANQAPIIALSQPADDATFIRPTDILLHATASDPDGTVTLVEFFRNGTRLGQVAAPPYEVTWSNAPAGWYALTAAATDNAGAVSLSAPVDIVVRELTGTTTNVLVARGAEWRYLDDGSDQGTGWTAPAFEDAGWASGPAQLGYGDGNEATVVSFGPNAANKHVTTYFRHSFSVSDPSRVQSLSLNLLRDDGAIVYVNGAEVVRLSLPSGPVDYLTFATTASEYDFEAVAVAPEVLRTGVNVIAVEVHQGNAASSDLSFDLELTGVLTAPLNNPPVVSVTDPPDGSTWAAPANLALSVRATDIDGQVTNLTLRADGKVLASGPSNPLNYTWNVLPSGVYRLDAVATDNLGLSATSTVNQVTISTNAAPPVILAQSPAPGTITRLSEITVTFSKSVWGVTADDLLVNGIPARSVSGSGSLYTFMVEQPEFGAVHVAWSSGAGIRDVFTPPQGFDPDGPGANWQYTLMDVDPPFLTVVEPLPGSTVPALSAMRITLNEPVTGLQATDLLINGSPATTLSGTGAGPYQFTLAEPSPGPIEVAWVTGHGIQDAAGNRFGGGRWSYTLDPSVTGIVISEIMYHPASENVLEEYMELFNRGPAQVDLTDWQLSSGVQFTFPSVSLDPGSYLVVAADLPTFRAKYPTISNVIGGWSGNLSNTREDIDLDDATGARVDSVVYADEGDWGVRVLDQPDLGVRGWIWTAAHDGEGYSAEMLNPYLSNNHGQNWAPSLALDGTPGRANSVHTNNLPPLILDAQHFPPVPGPTQEVIVTARVLDETVGGITLRVHYRSDDASPPPFTTAAMTDDGADADASAGDGIFTGRLPAQPAGTVVEFYLEASDAEGRSRTWPAGAWDIDGTWLGPVANLLYQVDDDPQNEFGGRQPVYKLIMTERERALLASIPGISTLQGPNSQMNGTFISLDGTGTAVRYLAGFRNRGHGTRRADPPNYRVNFRSDDPWKKVEALNLNSRQVHAQHFGSALARHAGAAGPASVAAQVRVNNLNRAVSGSPMFGAYAANEVLNGDWAARHVPDDDDGNVYRAVRDIPPPDFDYRTLDAYPQLAGPEDPASYSFTWYKETNVSEDDWTDLIGMLRILGPNGVTPFTAENVRQVVNVDQWLRHLAVMNLLGNAETGLNSGYNDDYYLYRGKQDPRFVLLFWDLDQILGISSLAPDASIFSATADNGAGLAMDRLLHWPEFEPLYYRTLQNLLDGPFSASEFHALLEQTLGDYVPIATRQAMESWMNARRAAVQAAIDGLVPPATVAPLAVLSGVPRSPTPLTTATIAVTGTDVTHYRYRLDAGAYSPEIPVTQPIQLSSLSQGTHTLAVVARTASGLWQSMDEATTRNWAVNPAWPTVRLNEVLALNDNAFAHAGTFPDVIELYNEGNSTVDLSGLRLSDQPANPGKFTFPIGTTLAAKAYLVVFANNPDGTPGLHLGFGLNADGEGVYLYHRLSEGGVLLDSVEFGLQIPDTAIGRLEGAGEWRLTQPTPGAANQSQPLGDPHRLRINEWLAFGQTSFPDDFVELYNPDPLPVALGGLFLTDEPNGAPTRHRLADLSFIIGSGFRAFLADGEPDQGADHLDFRLAAEQGMLALFDPDLRRIDGVVYGPQNPEISTGRCPDGAPTQTILINPTPGAANLCPTEPPAPQVVSVLSMDHTWRYDASGADQGSVWREPGFNDAAWPQGPGVLARENCDCLPDPILTPLTFTSPQQITFYFRTHFHLPADLPAASLEIIHLIDDGAIFYLNGVEIGRVNMPPGTVDYQTQASGGVGDASYGGPLPVPLGLVQPRDNLLAVEVHQSGSTSSDLVFGLRLDALVVTNTPEATAIVINEVLANNVSLQEADQSLPDWVELHNLSAENVDLADLSLTDTTAMPRRWVFPPGSILPASGYLTIRCDGGAPASADNSGFGLRAEGGSIYLFGRPADGGQLLNSLTYGLQPADWSVGRVPDGSTHWTLTLPTLGAANLAATLASPATPSINEWMADPATGDDWFELYNPHPQPLDISGLYLTDRLDQPSQHRLPPLSFLGSGNRGYQKFVADGNPAAGAHHVSFALDRAGDSLGLATADATEYLDALSFGPQQTGVSQGRFPDGATTVVAFPESVTPGRSNYLPLPTVVVNEVLTHTDPPLEDAVEFFNTTGDDIALGGWWISDSETNLRKYLVPPGTTLPANGFAVFYEDQLNGPDADSPFSFSSARGDEVFLSQTDRGGNLTGYRAYAQFGPAANGVSFGRFHTSQGPRFAAMNGRTFGVDTPGTVQEFRTGTGAVNAAALVGPIVFSEIMYAPSGNAPHLEFLELKNLTATNVPLYDPMYPAHTWRIRTGIDFDFPTGTVLSPGAFLLVVGFNPATDPTAKAAFEAQYGAGVPMVGPYAGSLSNDGELVELLRPDPPQTLPGPDFGLVPYILVDRVDYRAQMPWPISPAGQGASLQKIDPALYGDDPVNWMAAAATPGAGAPPVADSDGDGMPDHWELDHGLDPNLNDAKADADADRSANLDEYLAGTDPQDPSSVLLLAAEEFIEGTATLRLRVVAGRTYTVQYRTSLETGAWLRLIDVELQTVTRDIWVTDPHAGTSDTRYYRLTTP